jgi:hypothetical protein
VLLCAIFLLIFQVEVGTCGNFTDQDELGISLLYQTTDSDIVKPLLYRDSFLLIHHGPISIEALKEFD